MATSLKVLLCCFCIFVTTVYATQWLKKRDVHQNQNNRRGCDNSNACVNLYRPIYSVMQFDEPDFSALVDEHSGQISLDCRNGTLSAADACKDNTQQDLNVHRCFRVPGQGLFTTWDYFCQKKDEVEKLKDCWHSEQLTPTIMGCTHRISEEHGNIASDLPNCILEDVRSLNGCDESAGQILRGLLLTLFELHRRD